MKVCYFLISILFFSITVKSQIDIDSLLLPNKLIKEKKVTKIRIDHIIYNDELTSEIWYYDTNGNMIKKESVDSVGSVLIEQIYQYDSSNNLIFEKYWNLKKNRKDSISYLNFYLDAKLASIWTPDSTYTTSYKYDKLGRNTEILSKSFIKLTGTPIFGLSSHFKFNIYQDELIEYIYDKNNRKIEVRKYPGQDKTRISSDFIIEYNKYGQISLVANKLDSTDYLNYQYSKSFNFPFLISFAEGYGELSYNDFGLVKKITIYDSSSKEAYEEYNFYYTLSR